jgi:hypothetical protein
MGYIINDKNQSDLIKLQVIIPEGIVQTMDSSAPYTLLDFFGISAAIPVICYVEILNQSIQYDGFGHLHLTNTGQYTTDLCGSYAANSSITNALKTSIYSFLINFQSSPNRFGGVNNKSFPLQIFFDTLPTGGNGDMLVTLYYVKE